jgi:hypothetical protein
VALALKGFYANIFAKPFADFVIKIVIHSKLFFDTLSPWGQFHKTLFGIIYAPTYITSDETQGNIPIGV